MTVEGITAAIRHILQFLVPPLMNLFFITVLFELFTGTGIADNVKAWLRNMKSLVSTSVPQVVMWVQNTYGYLSTTIFTDPNKIPKLDDTSLLAPAIQGLGGLLRTTSGPLVLFVLLFTFILIVSVALITDSITLKLSDFLNNCFTWLCTKVVRCEFLLAAERKLVKTWIGFLFFDPRSVFFDPPSEGVVQFAKASIKLPPGLPDLTQAELNDAVLAWLSEHDSKGTSFKERIELQERYGRLQYWENHFRFYTALSLLLFCYAFKAHEPLTHIWVPIAAAIIWIVYSVRVWHSDMKIMTFNFKSFLYYKIALSENGKTDKSLSETGNLPARVEKLDVVEVQDPELLPI